MRNRLILSLLLILLAPFSAKSLPVKLHGICLDSTITRVTLARQSPFWQEMLPPTLLVEGKKQTNNSVTLQLNVDAPTVATFMILNQNVELYLQPNDSVGFTIVRENDRSRISFTGKNAAYYNYGIELEEYLKAQKQLYPSFAQVKDIQEYRKLVDERLRLKKHFLRMYVTRHALQENFVSHVLSDMEAEYVQFLYRPVSDGQVKREDLPEGYFSQSDTISLKETGLHHPTRSIMRALAHKYILASAADPWENFDAAYKSIREGYSGRARELLVTSLIGVYAKKQLQQYRPSLVKAIEEASAYVQDKECLGYIARCEQQYVMLNQPFPQDVLQNTFLTAYGGSSRISLAQLLEQYKGEAIYIDFWASWCSACRVDIANSAEAKKYMEEKKVRYIYISLDTEQNREKWRKASVKDGVTKDQYILAGDFSSSLAKFLKMQSLPQYLILNSAHELKNVEAPRPTPEYLANLRMSLTNALGQVKRYDQ